MHFDLLWISVVASVAGKKKSSFSELYLSVDISIYNKVRKYQLGKMAVIGPFLRPTLQL